MDIKRLTHFIALAEEGRFAAAAARVHLSPAAFSRSIQSLEERVGVRLFDRGAKGARITPAGEAVLRRAQRVVFESRSLERDLELLRGGLLGDLCIGAAPIPAAVLVPELLRQLRMHSPGLVVRVRTGNLPTLVEQLQAQQIDLCLGDPRLVPRSARRESLALSRQSVGLYARRGHPLLRAKQVTLADLAAYGVASVAVPEALRALWVPLPEQADASGTGAAVECDDLHVLLQLVASTELLGWLPDALARRHARALRALALHGGPSPYADIHALWLKGRTLSPAARLALQLLQGAAPA